MSEQVEAYEINGLIALRNDYVGVCSKKLARIAIVAADARPRE